MAQVGFEASLAGECVLPLQCCVKRHKSFTLSPRERSSFHVQVPEVWKHFDSVAA